MAAVDDESCHYSGCSRDDGKAVVSIQCPERNANITYDIDFASHAVVDAHINAGLILDVFIL